MGRAGAAVDHRPRAASGAAPIDSNPALQVLSTADDPVFTSREQTVAKSLALFVTVLMVGAITACYLAERSHGASQTHGVANYRQPAPF